MVVISGERIGSKKPSVERVRYTGMCTVWPLTLSAPSVTMAIHESDPMPELGRGGIPCLGVVRPGQEGMWEYGRACGQAGKRVGGKVGEWAGGRVGRRAGA